MNSNNQAELVSVIIAVYNGTEYIADAIESVLNQDHQHLELIIVNDGSTDHTMKVIEGFSDERLIVISQDNKGVSAARNAGLKRINGTYFTWLDADDIMPKSSLSARLKVFHDRPDTRIVDGKVKEVFHGSETEIISEWQPNFRGDPLAAYLLADDRVYYGASVMIRRESGDSVCFREGMTHCEDLLFLTELAMRCAHYDYTDTCVLLRRRTRHSAMSNLRGLETGYLQFIHEIAAHSERFPVKLSRMRRHFGGIMFKSFLKQGQVAASIRTLFKFAFC